MAKKTQSGGKRTAKNFTRKDFLQTFEEYQKLSGESALIRLMLKYDLLYWTVRERKDTKEEKLRSLDTIEDVLNRVNEAIWLYIGKDSEKKQREETLELLLQLREELKSRMDVLMAYDDAFAIHEYALNRVQYRFEQAQDLPADDVMAKQVMDFIFSDDDNAMINERLRMVIGEVPMRMARSRYFDMVGQSISLYRDSDKSALDGFLYMFQMRAMLCQNEKSKHDLTELGTFLDKLNALDYENITQEEYRRYTAEIDREAERMSFLSDLYLQMTEIVNDLIILFFCDFSSDKNFEEVKKSATLVLCGFCSLLCRNESEIWEKIGAKNADEEEKAEKLEEQFTVAEGVQEGLGVQIDRLSAVLEQAEELLVETEQEFVQSPELALFKKIQCLSSESTFADLTTENDLEKVTQKIIDEESEKLLNLLKESFDGKGKLLRRAVMASTLEQMPMFFQSAQEIFDYINASFAHCEDEAEKSAAKQLLTMIIDDWKK